MTGIETNLEALAEKEYRQDEVLLELYQINIEYWKQQRKYAEERIQINTDKILEIHRKRVQRNQEEQ